MKKTLLQKFFFVLVIYLVPLNPQVILAQMREIHIEAELSDSLPMNYNPRVIIENNLSDEGSAVKMNIVYVTGMPSAENIKTDSIKNAFIGPKEIQVSPNEKRIINPAGSSSMQVIHTPITPPKDNEPPK